MRIVCTFCGKRFASQRGLHSHLRSCKPSHKGKPTVAKITIPTSVNIPIALNNSPFANDDNMSECSISVQVEDDVVNSEQVSTFTDDEEDSIDIICNSPPKKIFRTARKEIEIQLLQFSEDIQAPIYAYDNLMTILSKCNINNENFII